jgi:AraC-like DNA-binding protein
MISVAALAGVPAWVRETFGQRILDHANRAAMLDIELIERESCFIPHAAMTGFLDEVERRTGEQHLGLLLAPHLSFSSYGLWSEYVLACSTLRGAIARATATLGYHACGDRMEFSVDRGLAKLTYFNASPGRPGHSHVASGTAGVMLDMIRSYLPAGWRPQRIELDIPLSRTPTLFEEIYQCPVGFGSSGVSVSFDARHLDLDRRSSQQRPVTLGDLARLRFQPGSLDGFSGAIVAEVWAQVLAGAPSLDSAARALDTSVRTLQRALNREGTDYRGLVNVVRVERAKELLAGSPASITSISAQLGYATPANFARAFRKATGIVPKEYRMFTAGKRPLGDVS